LPVTTSDPPVSGQASIFQSKAPIVDVCCHDVPVAFCDDDSIMSRGMLPRYIKNVLLPLSAAVDRMRG
jgi:hypothetical protein